MTTEKKSNVPSEQPFIQPSVSKREQLVPSKLVRTHDNMREKFGVARPGKTKADK